MSSTPKYSPSSGFLPSVASATLLARNSALIEDGDREDREKISGWALRINVDSASLNSLNSFSFAPKKKSD